MYCNFSQGPNSFEKTGNWRYDNNRFSVSFEVSAVCHQRLENFEKRSAPNGKALLLVMADHIPGSTTAHDSFHGTSIYPCFNNDLTLDHTKTFTLLTKQFREECQFYHSPSHDTHLSHQWKSKKKCSSPCLWT